MKSPSNNPNEESFAFQAVQHLINVFKSILPYTNGEQEKQIKKDIKRYGDKEIGS